MSYIHFIIVLCTYTLILLSFSKKFQPKTRKTNNITCKPLPGTPINAPFGKDKGIYPGRVVWSWNEKVTFWDGKSDGESYWWKYIDQEMLDEMFAKNIQSLTGGKTSEEAWEKIFKYFNEVHNGERKGYEENEKIVIKINLNVAHDYECSNGNSISPQFLKSVLRQLTKEGKVKESDITVYDGARYIASCYYDEPYGIGKEFPNINLVDNLGGKEYVQKIQPDWDSYFVFSNESVPAFNETKLPTVVTESKYMIVLSNFRGHDLAGVTLTQKNFFGSIYRPDCICDFGSYNAGHWCPKSLHSFVGVNMCPMNVYNPLVDLAGHKDLAGKGLLFLIDGLYSGIAEHINNEPIKFQTLNNHWSSSIFSSLDMIAIDSVAYDFLRNEPNQVYTHEGCIDNYLHEGASADNPPSGTVYNPTGKQRLDSLGVHEHWNNANDRQYSRNLGKNKGIELIQLD